MSIGSCFNCVIDQLCNYGQATYFSESLLLIHYNGKFKLYFFLKEPSSCNYTITYFILAI